MSSLEFRLKKIGETRNLIEEIKHNNLMTICIMLNYVVFDIF